MADEIKKWKKEEIVELLKSNDKAVLRGLVVVYSLQTQEEQYTDQTVENNGVGFSGTDAEFLSSLAKQFLERGWLSHKQMEKLRVRILKYAGQLTIEEPKCADVKCALMNYQKQKDYAANLKDALDEVTE